MPTPEGLASLEDAFGAAIAEQGEPPEDSLFGADDSVESALPAEGEQTPQDGQAPEKADDSVFADLDSAVETPAAPQGIDWNATVDLPGIERPVPLQEMRDGYLRQADYTRKTQALAAERKAFEEQHGQALRLFKSLTEDPAGTAAYLAVQTGVVDEQAVAGRARQLQDAWKPPPAPDQIEAEIERRVAEQVNQHPAVLEAQATSIQQRVNAEFSRIEGQHQIKLTAKDRLAVLQRAANAGTGDLGLVVEGMLRQRDRVRAERDQARQAAPTRPSVRAPSADSPARVQTVEDAFNLALAEVREAAS